MQMSPNLNPSDFASSIWARITFKTSKSSSLAYSFLLAIFPATIFLFTLIPYIPVKNFKGELFSILVLVLPKGAEEKAEQLQNDINNYEDMRFWHYVFGEPNDIKALFNSCKLSAKCCMC